MARRRRSSGLYQRGGRYYLAWWVGDITQYLGAELQQIVVTGQMDTNSSWYPLGSFSGNLPGDVLYAINHEAVSEPWQWFSSESFEGKVTIRDLRSGEESIIEISDLQSEIESRL